MSTIGLVFPILPGKEAVVREICRQLQERRPEYEESRARSGVSVERAYIQSNPDGSKVVLAYLETDRGVGDAMKALLASESPLDRYFVDKNTEATGIDFRTQLAGAPDPELVGQWIAPGNPARARGFAFTAPLQPGKTEAGREFAREAYAARQAEMTESRLAKKATREEVFLNHTPAGDMIVVYMEGDDPREANRQFAASNGAFDRWFKNSCRDIFPPYVDFDQPVPANEEIFSWTRAGAVTQAR
jgi:hypothetical protein